MSGPRRILIAAPRYPPARGGVERHVEMLARGLTGRGIGVELAVTEPGLGRPVAERLDGILVRRFPTVRGDGTYFAAPRLAAWVWRHAADYDIVHAHGYHTLVAPAAALAAARHRVPLVVTPHYHGTGHTRIRALLHVPYRPIGARLLGRADRVLCVSLAEARLLEAHFGPLRTTVVPNGIDVVDHGLAQPSAVAPGRTLVLSVGRLEPYKQVDRIVASLAHLPSSFELAIVGQGPADAAVRTVATRLGVSGRLRLLAGLPAHELHGWYAAARVFVSLSRHEAFGLTVLEGAAAGAAVVASDIPAHREVAGYAPPGTIRFVPLDASPVVVARAIAEASAGAKSRARVNATGASGLAVDGWRLPTWDGLADGVAQVYEEILAEAPRLVAPRPAAEARPSAAPLGQRDEAQRGRHDGGDEHRQEQEIHHPDRASRAGSVEGVDELPKHQQTEHDERPDDADDRDGIHGAQRRRSGIGRRASLLRTAAPPRTRIPNAAPQAAPAAPSTSARPTR